MSNFDYEIGSLDIDENVLEERSLEEIIKIKNLQSTTFAYFITSFIIGLTTFLKGYISGANIGEYDVVDAVITSSHHATVKYKNKYINCYVFTESLMGDKQFNFLYPQNTSITLLFDKNSFDCRTIELGNNLFIVGMVFLILCFVFFVIFVCTGFESVTKKEEAKYIEYIKNKKLEIKNQK
jgi:hypothetical protein